MMMLLVNIRISSPDTDALLAAGPFSSLEPFAMLEPLPTNRIAGPAKPSVPHHDNSSDSLNPLNLSEGSNPGTTLLTSLRDENLRLLALSAELMLKNEQLRCKLAEHHPDHLPGSPSGRSVWNGPGSRNCQHGQSSQGSQQASQND